MVDPISPGMKVRRKKVSCESGTAKIRGKTCRSVKGCSDRAGRWGFMMSGSEQSRAKVNRKGCLDRG